MKDPLVADLKLAQRLEGGWDFLCVENARSQNTLAPELGAEVLPVGGGHAVFLGTGSPLSQAQGVGMRGEVPLQEITRMEDFFRDRNAQVKVEVASTADPSLLVALSLRGYAIAEQTHCLVRRVSSRPPQRRPSGPTIVQVERGDLESWVNVVLDSFFETPGTVPPVVREGALAMALAPGNTAWLALVDGRPAGGASLFIHDGLALFCGDGTLSGYRRQGIQAALLHARLAHAHAAGCDLATICTQPGSGSQRNAERAGFHVAHARTMMVRELW